MTLANVRLWGGRIVLGLLFVVLLSACAAKFDTNEYSRMVDIRYSLDAVNCQDPVRARIMATTVKQHTDWLALYSQHLPDNSNTQAMVAALNRSAAGFSARYNNATPSPAYCRAKVQNLQAEIDIILKTTGRRPR